MPAKKKKAPRRRKTARRRLITPEDLTKFITVSSPRISPDGSRIVFVRKHVGAKNDYVTNLWTADTFGQGEPTQFTGGGKDGAPSFSPDGSRIAFVSGRAKPKSQIYLISASGGEAAALTSFPARRRG